MTDTKFERSCQKFKEAMVREYSKQRKLIKICTPPRNTKFSITSVETNLQKLEIRDLISEPSQKSDKLEKLVKELGIDKEDCHSVTFQPTDTLINNDYELRSSVLSEVLPNIQSLPPGKRTRFRQTTLYGQVEVYIRSSLDIWVIYKNEKWIFPKSRNDIMIE